MSCRRELIVNQIVALETVLKNYIDKSLFPSLDEIDITDLVFYITFTFMGLNTTESIGKKIIELMESNNITITEENLILAVPLVIDFIQWLRVL